MPSPLAAQIKTDQLKTIRDVLGLQSIVEKELFCSLDFSKHGFEDVISNNKEIRQLLKNLKREYAHELSEAYKTDGEDHVRDRWKSKYYAEIAKQEELINEPKIAYANIFNKLFSFTNNVRLFLIRTNMVLSFLGRAFLHRLFGLAGLMYAVRLMFDIGDVLKCTFFPEASDDKISRYTRFKNALTKDDRPSTMANDAVWFGINLLPFLVPPLLTAIVIANACGFVFDIGNEVYKTYYGSKEINLNLHNKFKNNIKKLVEGKQPEGEEKEKNEKTEQNINLIKALQLRLENKNNEIKHERIKYITLTAAVAVGMLMFMLPPVSLPMIGFIGASLVLGAGVVFFADNLQSTYKWLHPKKKNVKDLKEEEKVPVNGTNTASLNQLLGASASNQDNSVLMKPEMENTLNTPIVENKVEAQPVSCNDNEKQQVVQLLFNSPVRTGNAF